MLAEAKLRFDPLAQSIERMMDELTRFMWHLIRTKVRETVWVYASGKESGWKGMAPDDLAAQDDPMAQDALAAGDVRLTRARPAGGSA